VLHRDSDMLGVCVVYMNVGGRLINWVTKLNKVRHYKGNFTSVVSKSRQADKGKEAKERSKGGPVG